MMRELALWGARSLGPPTDESEFFEGWLGNALVGVVAEQAPAGRFEFHVDDEVASIVDGQVVDGPVTDPDVVVEGDPVGIYWMLVEGRLDDVAVCGDRALLDQLIEASRQFETVASG